LKRLHRYRISSTGVRKRGIQLRSRRRCVPGRPGMDWGAVSPVMPWMQESPIGIKPPEGRLVGDPAQDSTAHRFYARRASANDGIQIGLQLGMIKAAGRAFDGKPILRKKGVGLIAVHFPEGKCHGLELAPGDAGESIVFVCGLSCGNSLHGHGKVG